ncbi:hypothetical protein [Enterococcus saccharolyticus]|uniref:Uncharacterized protein n=1 Tax=Enterococcus saccharolyticus subsp. saccharolyticus ATCC 43076 TaxID=1139996 RepID=S0JKR8_9ENTE|nr:hypothetical protein [Enterococcus saccharolyticus]EOT28473.1 hypothetical protein OMQ_01622 [Enterococcus saccharolyticus subsp. saccharolyticus ATCC 43076]EOT81464.1 hypothetical protein I572_01999 [Enterococcus saccharolyticus subsp. saccharolyticus ATCC 43076]
MREKLAELGNQNRYTFQGKFQFYGYQGTGTLTVIMKNSNILLL